MRSSLIVYRDILTNRDLFTWQLQLEEAIRKEKQSDVVYSHSYLISREVAYRDCR